MNIEAFLAVDNWLLQVPTDPTDLSVSAAVAVLGLREKNAVGAAVTVSFKGSLISRAAFPKSSCAVVYNIKPICRRDLLDVTPLEG